MTIALLVPVTSRNRRLRAVADTELLRTLVPGVLATATWTRGLDYRLYVGYDAGDRFYDRADRRRALRRAVTRLVGDRPVTLAFVRCTGTAHAPCAVWNALFRRAYGEGCDFFYQTGDDVRFETGGWARAFRAALTKGTARGLGVAGPIDADRPSFPVLTQAFVSRVHMAIFGTFYPPAFRNWYSDNWITAVYAPRHAHRVAAQRVRNLGGAPRYRIEQDAVDLLDREVAAGRLRINAWRAWQRQLSRARKAAVR